MSIFTFNRLRCCWRMSIQIMVICLGERDCRKGVPSNLLSNILAQYVCSINANSLKIVKNNDHKAKNLSWLYHAQLTSYCESRDIMRSVEGCRKEGRTEEKRGGGAHIIHVDKII